MPTTPQRLSGDLVPSGTPVKVYPVGRRPPDYRDSLLLRFWLWVGWFFFGLEPCLPREDIGVASRPDVADAACLDETYYTYETELDVFLPPGPAPIRGLVWPRRKRQFHRDPAPEPELVVIEKRKLGWLWRQAEESRGRRSRASQG